MSDVDREPIPQVDSKVFCRRLERPLPISEHERCPYCFGGTAAIKTGEHERFCDFRPGKDPINFGFPEGGERDLHG